MAPAPIEDVLRRRSQELLAIPGVIGTGEGRHDGAPLFVIYVVRETAELKRRLPERIEGYAVDIRPSGQVKAPPP